jgi:hypothetical protein
VNLGQLDANTIVLGLIHPEETKIVEVMTAPISTISKTKIASSELKDVSDYIGKR